MTKAILIEANGNVRRIDIAGYDDLNKAVGGYIEGIHFGDTGQFAYLNEDGKAMELPYNWLATVLCGKHKVGLLPDDYISGNMVIVGPADDEGRDTDVSDELARELGV